jgi:hypothetical protein
VQRIVNSLNTLANPLLLNHPQINDNGLVTYTSADRIHILNAGVSSKIIGFGDALFGGTVKGLMKGMVNNTYLNNRGQIVFNYELTNGETGLAIATPASSPGPVLTSGSVANGATFGPGIVPGSWAQVKGTNLAPVSRIWRDSDFTNGNNLPLSLDGVEVRVNNLPAAIYYISPTQISFQVPAGVSGTVAVQVIRNGIQSASISANAVASSPGLFGYAAGGKVFPAGRLREQYDHRRRSRYFWIYRPESALWRSNRALRNRAGRLTGRSDRRHKPNYRSNGHYRVATSGS